MPYIDNPKIDINSIPMVEQAITPSTPPSGKSLIFMKADGLYSVDDQGSVSGPFVDADTTGWLPGEAWSYASADAPTFTMTASGDLTGKYSPGMRIKLSQTTVKYFIVTGVSYGAPNTTITLYGGTDYTLANAEITAPFYSREKAPLNFPLDPVKWTVEVSDTTYREQSNPSNGTWYNLGSITISIPIGCWNTTYKASSQVYSPSVNCGGSITLSTANNSESDVDFTAYHGGYQISESQMQVSKILSIAAKTSYYLNSNVEGSNLSSLRLRSDKAKTIIRAVCAYL